MHVSRFADRPDWLVGDGQAGQGTRRHLGQSLNELPIEHRFSLVCLTLVQRFPDAEDHLETGGQGNPYFLVDKRIGFAQNVRARCVQG